MAKTVVGKKGKTVETKSRKKIAGEKATKVAKIKTVKMAKNLEQKMPERRAISQKMKALPRENLKKMGVVVALVNLAGVVFNMLVIWQATVRSGISGINFAYLGLVGLLALAGLNYLYAERLRRAKERLADWMIELAGGVGAISMLLSVMMIWSGLQERIIVNTIVIFAAIAGITVLATAIMIGSLKWARVRYGVKFYALVGITGTILAGWGGWRMIFKALVNWGSQANTEMVKDLIQSQIWTMTVAVVATVVTGEAMRRIGRKK